MSLAKINSEFAKILLEKICNRGKLLFQNVAFFSCIYLDPRFHKRLTIEEKLRAKDHLVQTWAKLKMLKISDQVDAENNAKVEDEENSVEDSEFESYLEEKVIDAATEECKDNGEVDILLLLEAFEKTNRQISKTNILKYWNNQKCVHPYLFQLSEVVMAVPATQVSVERTFSQLKYVLLDQRCSMSSGILEDVMFIRCNKKFF